MAASRCGWKCEPGAFGVPRCCFLALDKPRVRLSRVARVSWPDTSQRSGLLALDEGRIAFAISRATVMNARSFGAIEARLGK